MSHLVFNKSVPKSLVIIKAKGPALALSPSSPQLTFILEQRDSNRCHQ